MSRRPQYVTFHQGPPPPPARRRGCSYACLAIFVPLFGAAVALVLHRALELLGALGVWLTT